MRAARTSVTIKPVIGTLAILFIFFCLEASIFRLGWYYKYVEPKSSAGMMEPALYWLRRFRPKTGVPEIAVVGDSRIAEGFSPKYARELTKGRYHFWGLGLHGSTPRVWYYFIRDADPSRNRFSSIILSLDLYPDFDVCNNSSYRLGDLNYVVGRLRITDAWDFASSVKGNQRAAFVGALLKGVILRRDATEFLQDIPGRISRTKEHREFGLGYQEGYEGFDRNVNGLALASNGTIRYPDGLSKEEAEGFQNNIRCQTSAQAGDAFEYRMRWLGAIIELYRNTRTKIVFLQLPRGPLPATFPKGESRFIEWAARQPNVVVMDAATFQYLEKPAFFSDVLHLNREGRKEFTEHLVATFPSVALSAD